MKLICLDSTAQSFSSELVYFRRLIGQLLNHEIVFSIYFWRIEEEGILRAFNSLLILYESLITKHITPWKWILFFYKETILKTVKKSIVFYGTWLLVSMCTRACHWTVTRVICIQSTFSHCFFKIPFNIVPPSIFNEVTYIVDSGYNETGACSQFFHVNLVSRLLK